MTVQHIAASIGPVVRGGASLLVKKAERPRNQTAMTGRSKPVAQHDLWHRRFASLRAQGRHGMQIDQERDAPEIANPLQLPCEKFVIGPVDTLDALFKRVPGQRFSPNLSESWQSARDKSQSASGAPAVPGSACKRFATAFNHIPVYVVIRPVQIQQCTRRIGHKQSGSGLPHNFDRQPVNKAILQPQPAKPIIAHLCQNMRGIRPARMRRRDQHRHWHRVRSNMLKCRNIAVWIDPPAAGSGKVRQRAVAKFVRGHRGSVSVGSFGNHHPPCCSVYASKSKRIVACVGSMQWRRNPSQCRSASEKGKIS